MTDAEELASLETTYANWIAGGCPQSYTTGDGRSVTKVDATFFTKRIDQLRSAVAAAAAGAGSGFYAAEFRRDY